MNKFFLVILFFSLLNFQLSAQNLLPINIAHRGASGYLPEHTLAAKALAYGQGADYIEQDIVLTADDIPIIIHDIHLDTVTDVARKFPERKRKDGRFYALDFTLAEIKTLQVNERIDLKTGLPVFPKRFPLYKSEFRISTLAEELEMIQGLNKSTGKDIGIYPEIKEPEWHRKEGHDISKIVLFILNEFGYKTKEDKCYLQCFDAKELKRIRAELKSELALVQLLEEDTDLNEVAKYADGIGPSIKQIITEIKPDGKPVISDMVKLAHQKDLVVHPYTFRVDSLPFSLDSDKLLNVLFKKIKIDGIFSDFPDVTAKFLKKKFKK
ncbi:MAG: glycerophosphoryl diester phosphodiesterase [Clostridiales bacterium]|jgi:glycerophosphoryl diester phosphodiesterase|nr:glycerophosphoryl diester phosphodiesterase [Clostridiales bacterium]MDN5281227.1 glycerophosphoryl diester phosphodiesterase [Candidatus Ozemobacter sp.]